MVPGNGEYVDQELTESRKEYRAAVQRVPNAVFLDDEAVTTGLGVRVIGSTLWSRVAEDQIDAYTFVARRLIVLAVAPRGHFVRHLLVALHLSPGNILAPATPLGWRPKPKVGFSQDLIYDPVHGGWFGRGGAGRPQRRDRRPANETAPAGRVS